MTRVLFYESTPITKARVQEAKAARKQGKTKWETSHPCPHCASTVRYVSSLACVPCSIQRASNHRLKRLKEQS